jgi:hypothetical protein
MHLGRIEFNIVLFMDWSLASGCSPPRLSTTQLPSATDRPVLLSDRDFHPTIGAYFQAHSSSPFGARHFASGYDHAVPMDEDILRAEALIKLALMGRRA